MSPRHAVHQRLWSVQLANSNARLKRTKPLWEKPFLRQLRSLPVAGQVGWLIGLPMRRTVIPATYNSVTGGGSAKMRATRSSAYRVA
jgi:hypothetical protein